MQIYSRRESTYSKSRTNLENPKTTSEEYALTGSIEEDALTLALCIEPEQYIRKLSNVLRGKLRQRVN